MHRTAPIKTWLLVALTAVGVTFLTAAPSTAQVLFRETDLYADDGEPTDPEKALSLLDGVVDLEEHGLASTPPADEGAISSWFDALLDLLRSLGLVVPEEG